MGYMNRAIDGGSLGPRRPYSSSGRESRPRTPEKSIKEFSTEELKEELKRREDSAIGGKH